MHNQVVLLNRHPAERAAPEAGAVHDVGASAAVTELVRRWFELSLPERRSFAALTRDPGARDADSHGAVGAVSDLGARFQELADIARVQCQRAGAVVELAKTIELDGETMPLDQALHSVEAVLMKVIETILSISKHAMRMVYALDDVVRDVRGAEQCVGQIDSINTQTRYLALNAAIEANRSGEAGAAFRVIAHEIKDLSRATEETSRQVRDRITSITSGVHNGHQVLQEIATLDMSEHIMAKARLDALIAGLMAQNRAFTAALGETAGSAETMGRTIDGLIAGLRPRAETS